MAISKILNIKECKTRDANGTYLRMGIDYIINPDKTEDGSLVGSANMVTNSYYSEMIKTKKSFDKLSGRQGYHIIISFPEDEVNADLAYQIIEKFVDEYIGREYQTVFAIHTNTDHIHGHIIFNSVSFIDGRKYHYNNGDWQRFIQPVVNKVCAEYGLSQIDVTRRVRKEANPIISDMIRAEIDVCIKIASSFDSFIELLENRGYEVKRDVKYIAVLPPGAKRYKRLRSLGDDYTEESIRTRIRTEVILPITETKVVNRSPRIVESVPIRHFKRAKLSGIQKRYFLKMYKTRRLKKRVYSQAYKYRDDLYKLKQYEKQFKFLLRNSITTKDELIDTVTRVSDELKSIRKEKSKLFKERSSFKEDFAILDKLNELDMAHELFNMGETQFKDIDANYIELEEKLHFRGFNVAQVRALKDDYRRRISEITKREKKALEDKAILSGLIEEAIEANSKDRENLERKKVIKHGR